MTPNRTLPKRNLLYVNDLSRSEILSLFGRANTIRSEFIKTAQFPRSFENCQVAFLFQEASTRTRVSFQSAVQRMGAQTLLIEAGGASSLSKGESFKDTFYTLLANAPEMIVVRCSGDSELQTLADESPVPVVNGGFGSHAHPTQGLLDMLTLSNQGLSLDGLKCLFVGDLRHSRVFASHRRLAKILGYRLGGCGPAHLLPEDQDDLVVFEVLEEGMAWSDVYCGLRVQFERHGSDQMFSKEAYLEKFSLTKERLALLDDASWITHPGPIHWGTEFQAEVEKSPRLLFREQMETGVYLRAAVMEFLRDGVVV